MILTLKQIQRLEYGFTVLLAALPSLYLLFNYPPFFNGTDAACYLAFPGSGVPHYPLFYPMYCSILHKLIGDGIGFVYAIVLGQHIFYTVAVLYIAFYIKPFKRRVLFLCCMFFAFRATVYVHGMYTEAPAIIAIGFMLGALLRICLDGDATDKRVHYIIYFVAGVLLLLSRFAGVFLIFVLPLFTLLKCLLNWDLFNRPALKKLGIQAGLSFGFIVVAQVVTIPELLYEHAGEWSVYGEPGCYRIWDALSPGNNDLPPGQVLARYKNCTNDTLVKCTFDIIKRSKRDELWASVLYPLDSLQKEFIAKGIITKGRSMDSYLNAAYDIYINSPRCFPCKQIVSDIGSYFFDTGAYNTVAGDCKFLLSRPMDSLPTRTPRLQTYMHTHYTPEDYDKLSDDYIIASNSYRFIIPFLLVLMFLFKYRVDIAPDLWLLFVVITVTGCFSHVITGVITDRIMRYVQPAEFMIYAVWCVVIATCWPFKSDNELVPEMGTSSNHNNTNK